MDPPSSDENFWNLTCYAILEYIYDASSTFIMLFSGRDNPNAPFPILAKYPGVTDKLKTMSPRIIRLMLCMLGNVHFFCLLHFFSE